MGPPKNKPQLLTEGLNVPGEVRGQHAHELGLSEFIASARVLSSGV
jgi:hypothetical protein